jgi:hypothetical protein
MKRPIVATVVLLAALLAGLNLLASADEPVGGNPEERLPLATILASPDQYAGKEVVVRAWVVEMTRAVFPNGRPYYTLTVSEGHTAITVFSWERPSVERGDLVEVVGVFYPWRYNLHLVIESRRITRAGSSTGRLRTIQPSGLAEEVVTIPGTTRTCGEPA